MTPEQIRRLLRRREHTTVEFKKAREKLPDTLFETVCAFLSRDGGTILLGVADDGTVTGVEPGAVAHLTVDIVNLSNNRQKLDPPCILTPEVVEYEGMPILVLHVPSSPQVHR